MSARDILERIIDPTKNTSILGSAQNLEQMLYIACGYIDNQQDNAGFEDFVKQYVEEGDELEPPVAKAKLRYGWGWIDGEGPDEAGNRWIEIATLDAEGCLEDELAVVMLRDADKMEKKYPGIKAERERIAIKIVNALNRQPAHVTSSVSYKPVRVIVFIEGGVFQSYKSSAPLDLSVSDADDAEEDEETNTLCEKLEAEANSLPYSDLLSDGD
jgi:hypothetical protein